jgi:hypothetical protein
MPFLSDNEVVQESNGHSYVKLSAGGVEFYTVRSFLDANCELLVVLVLSFISPKVLPCTSAVRDFTAIIRYKSGKCLSGDTVIICANKFLSCFCPHFYSLV